MASVAAKLKKAQLKSKFLEEKSEGDLKNSGLKTLADIGLSVIVGGGLGAVIGKPAFLIGLGGTFAGHYTGINWITPIGVGMMASSNLIGGDSVSGFDLQGVKDRLMDFKDSLLQRTYLDKVIKKKSPVTDEGTSGLGNVAEYNKALKDVEEQLVQSAMDFQRRKGESTAGIEDELKGGYETDFSGM